MNSFRFEYLGPEIVPKTLHIIVLGCLGLGESLHTLNKCPNKRVLRKH